MRHPVLVALGTAMVLGGCASGSKGGSAAPAPSAARRPTSTMIISAEELASQPFQNALQAVMTLRPTWDHLNIYIDEQPVKFFNALQDIPIDTVKEIRMISREQARARWGIEAQAAILVTRKKK
jgi:hypothetical protein